MRSGTCGAWLRSRPYERLPDRPRDSSDHSRFALFLRSAQWLRDATARHIEQRLALGEKRPPHRLTSGYLLASGCDVVLIEQHLDFIHHAVHLLYRELQRFVVSHIHARILE